MYRGIDLFKFISAIFIIILHVSPFSEGTIFNIIFRQIICIVGVPYFFSASGFLLSKKSQNDVKKSVKNNYQKYLIWSLIYFPIVILGWKFSENSIGDSLLLYVRDFIFEGSYLTIWFLNALAFAIAFEWILLKKFNKRTCFFISIPCFLISCLLSSYNEFFTDVLGARNASDLYYSVFSSTKNGLLFGFPFVSLGVYVGDILADRGVSKKFSSAGMLISFVFLVIEVVFRNRFFAENKSVDFAIFLIPFTAFALLLSASLKLKPITIHRLPFITKGNLYLFLRYLSVLMFLTQRIFIFSFEMYGKISERVHRISIVSTIPIVKFLLVLICTIAFSYCVMRISEKHNWIQKTYK